MYAEFVIQLLGKKLLKEDRTFQDDALKVAIVNEVASKETLEVQNDAKPGNESMHVMGKSRIPGNISNSRNPLNQHNQKPSPPTFQKSSWACYPCGSTLNILEPSVSLNTDLRLAA